MGMHPLTASQVLDVWERGYGQSPAQRALTLLKAASPEEASKELAGLTVGRRDARLLRLREMVFGPALSSVVACPSCGERLEFSLSVGDVLVEHDAPAEVTLSVDEFDVTVRLPTAADLVAVASAPASDSLALLKRCIVQLEQNSEPTDVEALPEHVVAIVDEKLAEVDPQANLELAVECPACRYAWDAPLDIVTYVWAEIDAWAQRTLRDVHVLAAAYGWREGDILAMSAWRRQLYLQMVSV